MARVRVHKGAPAAVPPPGDELDDMFGSIEPIDVSKLPPEAAASLLESQIIDEAIKERAKQVLFDPKKWAVKGNTYPIKDQLKALGCRWNGEHWVARDQDMFNEALQLMSPRAKQSFPTYAPPPPPAQQTLTPTKKKTFKEKLAGTITKTASGAIPVGAVVSYTEDGKVEVAAPEKNNHEGIVKQLSNAVLAAELEHRGFVVMRAKKGESLAELLNEELNETAIDDWMKELEEQ